MRLLIDVPDKRAGFFLELLKQCDFVKTTLVESNPKPATTQISARGVSVIKESATRSRTKTASVSSRKKKIFDDLQESIEDVKRHRKGTLKLKSLKEVLDEL